jgi:hypothetical protein
MDRANAQRPFDPGTDKTHLVIEADATSRFEQTDLFFDFLAEAVAPLLEKPDLLFDLTLDKRLSELKQAKLPPDLLFKLLQGRQRHGHPRDKNLAFLEHP